MTLEQFKEKHSGLIARGVIEITRAPNIVRIVLDRYDELIGFIATVKETAPARRDIRKMGFTKVTSIIGLYVKRTDS